MNKNIINSQLPVAYEALKEERIVSNGRLNKTFRGQISTFGAAVSMGSLTAAIAFFSDNGSSSVERSKLMKAISYILQKQGTMKSTGDAVYDLFTYADKNGEDARESILNAAIALKLAMNLYQYEED